MEENYTCSHCNKICKSLRNLRQHERCCPVNPNRFNLSFYKKGKLGGNQFTKAKELGLPVPISVRKGKPSTFKGKKHSEESKRKTSESRRKYLREHPDRVPYILNHFSKGPSYPEKYWMELIQNEHLNLQYHKQVNVYELDFYNDEIKLDLEIDGEQHYLDPRIVQSDIRRTQYLMDLGWSVLRVRWAEWKIKSEDDKKLFVQLLRERLSKGV